MTDPVYFADGPLRGTTYQHARYQRVIAIPSSTEDPEVHYMDTGERNPSGALVYREVHS